MLDADSEQQMAEYLGLARYERTEEPEEQVDSRNGFYERDYVTPQGAIRLRVRRTRKRSFLPRGIATLQRRAPEVAVFVESARTRVSRQPPTNGAPRARHQRCWVHKMRNLLDGVRRRDYARIKRDAQRIYLARDAAQARRAFRRFRFHWHSTYRRLVRRLERDLPELLTFFDFPQPL